MPRAAQAKKWTKPAMGLPVYFRRDFGSHILLFGEIHACGFESRPRNSRHWHNHYEPCVVASGSGTFEHSGETFSLGPGDCFVADPHVVHEIRSLRTRDLQLWFASFAVEETGRSAGGDAREAGGWLTRFLAGHRVWCPGRPEVVAAFRHAHDFGPMAGPTFQARAVSEAILCAAVALGEGGSGEPRDMGREQDWVTRVERAIEAGLDQPISLAGLARKCGISERHLSRLFRAVTGQSVMEAVVDRRMARAARLLLRPEFGIAAVGEAVGIPDPSQFSRTFRRVRGMTPQQHRGRMAEGRVPSGGEGLSLFQTTHWVGRQRGGR